MPRKKSGEFDQNKYIADYAKSHYKRIELRIRFDELEVIKKLESVPSKNAYIVELIKNDIKKSN